MQGVIEAWSGTWKRSRAAGCIPNDMFEDVTRAAITQLLARGMEIRGLCASSHPSVLLSWVAFERDKRKPGAPVIHYLFTREPVRGRGMARLLLDSIGAGKRFIYTHQTTFAKKYWPDAVHLPGIARRKSL